MTPGSAATSIDQRLLRGFEFRCRPDCSLCCYASPSVTPQERKALLRIEPEARFLVDGEGEPANVACRKGGGACTMLHDRRCRVYAERPFPCREFPVSVHIGTRLQATVVLACPGLSLDPLLGWAGGKTPETEPRGLGTEVRAAEQELEGKPVTEWLEEGGRLERKARERLTRGGRWEDPAVVIADLVRELPWPGEEDFPPNDPPGSEEGWDALPFFFDERLALVTYRSSPLGWEAFQMREAGGPQRPLAQIPRIEVPPELTSSARTLLKGYLNYTLARDFFLWLTYRELEAEKEATLREMMEALLRELAVQAVARGTFRSLLAGQEAHSLDEVALGWGIRAVDNDFLDQATLGGIL